MGSEASGLSAQARREGQNLSKGNGEMRIDSKCMAPCSKKTTRFSALSNNICVHLVWPFGCLMDRMLIRTPQTVLHWRGFNGFAQAVLVEL